MTRNSLFLAVNAGLPESIATKIRGILQNPEAMASLCSSASTSSAGTAPTRKAEQPSGP